MVKDRRDILDHLSADGIDADAFSDVIFSHHHPNHTLNAALFPHARFHDHWAIYRDDVWLWRDADGHEVAPHVTLMRTPGHTREDITTLVTTSGGTVAVTHLWNTASSESDRHAEDLVALHENREKVLAVASLIVPGHGPGLRAQRLAPRGSADKRRAANRQRSDVLRRSVRPTSSTSCRRSSWRSSQCHRRHVGRGERRVANDSYSTTTASCMTRVNSPCLSSADFIHESLLGR